MYKRLVFVLRGVTGRVEELRIPDWTCWMVLRSGLSIDALYIAGGIVEGVAQK